MLTKVLLGAAIATSLLAVPRVAAQEAVELGGPSRATRNELEASLRQVDDAAQSRGVSDERRSQLRVQLAAIRSRLTEGDFRTGDRIAIVVQGDTIPPAGGGLSGRPVEQQLSDTFTVNSAQELDLPVVGAVSLRGVLRAELKTYLTKEVGRFVRDPVLDAWPLIRVSVQGAVLRPGYYTLPLDAALSDALMAAGGPARGAKIGKLRIERDGKSVWQGNPLQRAIADGRTLADMSLRAGDQFMLPETRPVVERGLRIVGLTLAIPVAIVALTRD
jgi:protein involved in polysaccharide export with SLBB domain